jgi:DNA polymerase Ligase (LigD)
VEGRFVIQRHCSPAGDHFDFMLECADAMATWQLPAWPPPCSSTLPATALADHRKAYLDYQGEISGGRGSVRIVDSGRYETLERREGLWLVRLAGQVFSGSARLERSAGTAWTLSVAEGPR